MNGEEAEEKALKIAGTQSDTPHAGDPNAGRRCPRCKKGRLYDRVPRAYFVKIFLFFLPLRRYKCYYCGKRPYILS